MTNYHGGKQKIGKELSTLIYDISTQFCFEPKGYCEPFCGMLGVFQYIPKLFGDNIDYIASDINGSVIEMWKKAKNGWIPPINCDKDIFNNLKKSTSSSEEKGFIGHACSFRNIYFGSYASHTRAVEKVKESSKNVVNIANNLKNVNFLHGDYTEYKHLKNYIIYCDPPYEISEKRYYTEDLKINKFDALKFWDFCRYVGENNIVIVSEYSAPNDIQLVKNIGRDNIYIIYPKYLKANLEF